jgi:hypothetical protein
MSEEVLRGYHYTNPRAYNSMEDGYTYGWKGLLPIKRFISFGEGNSLPEEAYLGTVQGLLEPEPSSWKQNPEFPNLWACFLGKFC